MTSNERQHEGGAERQINPRAAAHQSLLHPTLRA
jgi:hypothetical protein